MVFWLYVIAKICRQNSNVIVYWIILLNVIYICQFYSQPKKSLYINKKKRKRKRKKKIRRLLESIKGDMKRGAEPTESDWYCIKPLGIENIQLNCLLLKLTFLFSFAVIFFDKFCRFFFFLSSKSKITTKVR